MYDFDIVFFAVNYIGVVRSSIHSFTQMFMSITIEHVYNMYIINNMYVVNMHTICIMNI